MNEAIKLAIEGGYKCTLEPNDWGGYLTHDVVCITVCDSLFWQALGKAMGWGTSCQHYSLKFGWETYRHAAKCVVGAHAWEANWHRFVDALSEGQTPDEFFSKLLQ